MSKTEIECVCVQHVFVYLYIHTEYGQKYVDNHILHLYVTHSKSHGH